MTPYYERGGITIYHGDCLEVLPNLPAQSIDAVISDPPYGMKWNTDATRFSGGSMASAEKRGQGRKWGVSVIGDDQPFDPSPWLGFPRVVLWGYHHFASCLPSGSVLVWLKRLDPAFGSFLSDAELAWMKGGHGVYCKRDLSMNAEATRRLHPTQKPVSLMTWCIEMAKVPPNGVILDPFMGSGTTLVAAKQLGRRAIGIEIREDYCAVAVDRLSQDVLPLELAV